MAGNETLVKSARGVASPAEGGSNGGKETRGQERPSQDHRRPSQTNRPGVRDGVRILVERQGRRCGGRQVNCWVLYSTCH